MPATIRIPASLSSWLNGKEDILCCGNTIKECFNYMEKNFPGFFENLSSNRNEATNFLIFLNGENIMNLDGQETNVKDGDEISIIPFAAGG